MCHVLKQHPDVTFAARLEVVHDHQVVASARAWWRGTSSGVTPFEGNLDVSVSDERQEQAEPGDGRWQLHILSDPEGALRDFDSSRYWKGDVMVPIQVTDSSTWEQLRPSLVEPSRK